MTRTTAWLLFLIGMAICLIGVTTNIFISFIGLALILLVLIWWPEHKNERTR
jgi:hypothetical protein